MWRYQLLLIVLSPLLVVYTLWTGIRIRSGRYILQRLGLSFPDNIDKAVWLHAASVGEVMAAQPLLEKLINEKFADRILISTITPTGAEIALKHASKNIVHCYLPVDWPFAVSRFIKALHPETAFIMETEIWPNLFRACGKNGIPIITINGRLSSRSLNTFRWVKALYKNALSYNTLVLTRSDIDTKNYVSLGASPEKVKTIGNIKFAVKFPDISQDNHPCANRAYLLAASTHDDEELRLARLWKDAFLGKYLLVLVPRHPNRLPRILDQLNTLNFNIAVRSRNEPISGDTQIYIADTMGELPMFMKHAELIFMGGTLVPVGGHNILEPAKLGKTILFGPHMENFAEEARLFLDCEAAVQVTTEEDLLAQIKRITGDEAINRSLGENARSLMEREADVTDRYYREIKAVV